MANYDLNMNGQFINNCLDPALAQDVATKSYVDKRAVEYTAEGQIQYAGPSPYLPTILPVGASGDVLTLAGSPALPTWAPPTGTTNGFVFAATNAATQTNTNTGLIGAGVQHPFSSISASSGICSGASGFTVNGGNLKWNGTVPIAFTMNISVQVLSTVTSSGNTAEFTSVAPINGSLPASQSNPPYLNLYMISGIIYNIVTQSSSIYTSSSATVIGCGNVADLGTYYANIPFTGVLHPNDTINLGFYSNGAFNQNWIAGPSAGVYTLTVSTIGTVNIYCVECPYPV